MPERPRPDIDEVRQALREHDAAREDDEETRPEDGAEAPAPDEDEQ